MEKVIYNLVFNRKKQLNAEGKALVQVEAYLNKRKRYFSTKVYIKPCQWDSKRRVVKNHSNRDALNKYLDFYISEMERIELRQKELGVNFTLRELVIPSSDPSILPEAPSFIAFMDQEIRQGDLKKSTLKNHLSTVNILGRYTPKLTFSDLSFNFLCEFEHYLCNEGYHKNTIAKHMKHIKRYLNLAINKDLFELQKYPFRKYKIKYVDTKRTHLTPEELQCMENLDLSGQLVLRKTLDAFLFSCYTGLRFSDIVCLTQANFHKIEGNLWLIYSSVKTNVNVRLPLFLLFDGKSIPIYERYANKWKTLFNISISANSCINKRLTRLSAMASLTKKISFHAARHTNATLLLYNGANITTVQKLLGHRSVRTTEIYSDIMDMTIVRDLEKISALNITDAQRVRSCT